jgi:hypothetical protein
MFIAFKVLVYIRFIPLLAAMNTRPTLYPPIYAFNTIGACPGLGTFLGWSSLLNLTVWSDHRRYSVVAGGDDIARFTCLDILFCSFLDFGTGWIIADMYIFDCGWPVRSVFDIPDLWLPCHVSYVLVVLLGLVP